VSFLLSLKDFTRHQLSPSVKSVLSVKSVVKKPPQHSTAAGSEVAAKPLHAIRGKKFF
jgi:hypothetical protein